MIDADKLESISSAGLRVLMKLRKKTDRALTMTNVSPEVYDIFEVTGFTELMDVKKRLGRDKGEAEVRRMLGFEPARAAEVWRLLCGAYFGLSSDAEIEARTQMIMPYSMLWNAYHRINRFRRDSAMLQIMVDTALRGDLLPAIERAQPLDF